MAASAERHALWGASPRPELDAVVRRVGVALDAPVALLTLVGERRQFHLAARASMAPYRAERFVPLGYSFCQHVVGIGRTLVVEDAWSHPLVRRALAVEEVGVTAYLGAPLRSATGERFGALCAADMKVRRWTDRERRFIEIMARLTEARIARLRPPEPT